MMARSSRNFRQAIRDAGLSGRILEGEGELRLVGTEVILKAVRFADLLRNEVCSKRRIGPENGSLRDHSRWGISGEQCNIP